MMTDAAHCASGGRSISATRRASALNMMKTAWRRRGSDDRSGSRNCMRHLVDEIDTYLARLNGAEEGIAAVRAGHCDAYGWRLSVRLKAALRFAARSMKPWTLPAHKAMERSPTRLRTPGPHLPWVTYDSYPRELIGARFPKAHAFVSLIGAGAPFEAEDFDLGLVSHRTAHALSRSSGIPHPNSMRRSLARIAGASASTIRGKALTPISPSGTSPTACMRRSSATSPFLAVFAWTRDVHAPAIVVPAPTGPRSRRACDERDLCRRKLADRHHCSRSRAMRAAKAPSIALGTIGRTGRSRPAIHGARAAQSSRLRLACRDHCRLDDGIAFAFPPRWRK